MPLARMALERGRFNTLIPYSKEGCKPHKPHPRSSGGVWYGMIMVWWAHDGRLPEWGFPDVPEIDSGGFYPMFPYSHTLHRIKAHTQAVLENLTDPAHVQFVHGAGRPAELRRFEIDGIRVSASLEVPYGVGTGPTRLTPDGEVTERVDIDVYGIGFALLRFGAIWPTIQISSITPVDDTYCDYYFQQTSKRVPGESGDEPAGLARIILELQRKVITQDFFTWANMKYLAAPDFTAEEAKNFAALRRWCRQFYPAEAIGADVRDPANGRVEHRVTGQNRSSPVALLESCATTTPDDICLWFDEEPVTYAELSGGARHAATGALPSRRGTWGPIHRSSWGTAGSSSSAGLVGWCWGRCRFRSIPPTVASSCATSWRTVAPSWQSPMTPGSAPSGRSPELPALSRVLVHQEGPPPRLAGLAVEPLAEALADDMGSTRSARAPPGTRRASSTPREPPDCPRASS